MPWNNSWQGLVPQQCPFYTCAPMFCIYCCCSRLLLLLLTWHHHHSAITNSDSILCWNVTGIATSNKEGYKQKLKDCNSGTTSLLNFPISDFPILIQKNGSSTIGRRLLGVIFIIIRFEAIHYEWVVFFDFYIVLLQIIFLVNSKSIYISLSLSLHFLIDCMHPSSVDDVLSFSRMYTDCR